MMAPDVLVYVEDARFKVHKQVLMEKSDFFHSMFTHSLRESQENTAVLRGLEEETFETLLKFMYTSEMSLTEDYTEFTKILFTATYLQIPKALQVCDDYLQRHMNGENCAEMAVVASNHGLAKLETAAIELVSKNFPQATESTSFLYLYPTQMIKLIDNSYTFTCAELDIFEAYVKWFRFNFEERAKFVGKIMSKIRFALISLRHIEEDVFRIAAEFADREFIRMVLEARDWHLKKFEQSVCVDINITARVPPVMTLIGGLEDANQDSSLAMQICRAPSASKLLWEPVTTVPKGFQDAAVACAVVEDFLYVLGFPTHFLSSDSMVKEHVSLFYRYDSRQHDWLPLRKPRVKHAGMTLTAIGDKLYACGSASDNIVESYSIRTNKWSNAARLPHDLFLQATETVAGKLYISGGLHEGAGLSQASGDLLRFDPESHNIVALGPMRSPRFGHCLVAVGNKLYVFGGTTFDPEIISWRFAMNSECYDVMEDVWTEIPSIPSPRSFFGALAWGDVIYVVGGTRDGVGLMTVHVYDVRKKTWESRPKMQRRLFYPGLVMLCHPCKKNKKWWDLTLT
ncbi:kelch-like protein 13 [Branchiostoma lanceolatum]|uniref:kelch-like protein 13 n=1 Tax=Branchiostoma lanceolatum TaxID=7740 RepID=UPI003453E989